VLIERETAYSKHVCRSRSTYSKRRSSTHPQRSRKWRGAGDLSLAFGRSHAAFAYADAGFLGFLHESGALPELLWRDGCCEDSEELVLCMSSHLPYLPTVFEIDLLRIPHRHHQSTTHASLPCYQLPVSSQDLQTSTSPMASIRSLHTAQPRN
jgi:hypothetical protein